MTGWPGLGQGLFHVAEALPAPATLPAEYWLVNPADETIIVYRLHGTRYARHGRFRRGQQAASALLAGLTVAVAAVFDAD